MPYDTRCIEIEKPDNIVVINLLNEVSIGHVNRTWPYRPHRPFTTSKYLESWKLINIETLLNNVQHEHLDINNAHISLWQINSIYVNYLFWLAKDHIVLLVLQIVQTMLNMLNTFFYLTTEVTFPTMREMSLPFILWGCEDDGAVKSILSLQALHIYYVCDLEIHIHITSSNLTYAIICAHHFITLYETE